jgi:hypothetical protein
MKITFLIVLLTFTPTVWANEMPNHWPTPLSTEQVELYKQKQDIVNEIGDRIKLKPQFIFYDARSRIYQIGQKDPCRVTRTSHFISELKLHGVIEVLGLVLQSRNENFDFSRPPSIKGNTPLIKRADGRRYRPLSADEIEDPEVRADYIKKAKKMKEHAKQYNFELELNRGWKEWFRDFHQAVQGLYSNQTKNAVDREKVKVVYELVRTANITEASKEKLRFWLTMMVECDKSLVKKAREEGDQSCANYVKELQNGG